MKHDDVQKLEHHKTETFRVTQKKRGLYTASYVQYDAIGIRFVLLVAILQNARMVVGKKTVDGSKKGLASMKLKEMAIMVRQQLVCMSCT